MKTFIIAIVIFCAAIASAQTISPVWAESGKGKAAGDVTLTNNYLTPISTTIEAYSVHIVDGKPTPGALDAGVSVRLAQGSARIAPKDSHEFSYKIHCDHVPCFVTFIATSIIGHTSNGAVLAIQENSSAYICDKAKDCRKRIFADAGVVLK